MVDQEDNEYINDLEEDENESGDSSGGIDIQSTQEYIVEQSWIFLAKLTEVVSNLSDSIQEKIFKIGETLVECDLIYIHVVEQQHKAPVSPAKQQAVLQKSQEVSNGDL